MNFTECNLIFSDDQKEREKVKENEDLEEYEDTSIVT